MLIYLLINCRNIVKKKKKKKRPSSNFSVKVPYIATLGKIITFINNSSFVGGQNIPEAQEYRNYVVGKMSFEISEIIRVLQYTTYEEEGGDDPLNDMKKAMSLFDSNMGPALKWVNTPTESAGGLGELVSS